MIQRHAKTSPEYCFNSEENLIRYGPKEKREREIVFVYNSAFNRIKILHNINIDDIPNITGQSLREYSEGPKINMEIF